MELSQTSLAVLLLGGLPVGVALSFAYALTDVAALPQSFIKALLVNAKDFIFLLAAGLAAVLTVYYVNQGEFRYLVLVGMIGGFAISHVTLGKLIVHARDAMIRFLTVPIIRAWEATLGRLAAKARARKQIKITQERVEELMQFASNGFEN